jgi:HSP20 family protein
MANDDPRQWMWDDALDMLARAERLHRQLFQPASTQARRPTWEPPVDLLETPGEVVIIAALPGVAEASLKLVIEGAQLMIAGERTLPDELRTAIIHRLALPAGRYDQIRHRAQDGLLIVSLRKLA